MVICYAFFFKFCVAYHIPDHVQQLINSLYSNFHTSDLSDCFRTPFIKVRLRLHGILERFCMVPRGTGRLPVYTTSWNRSVQNRSFQSIHA